MRIRATQVASATTFVAGITILTTGCIIGLTPLIITGISLFLVGALLAFIPVNISNQQM